MIEPRLLKFTNNPKDRVSMSNQLPLITQLPLILPAQIEAAPKAKIPPPAKLTPEQTKSARPISEAYAPGEKELLEVLKEKPFLDTGKENKKFDFAVVKEVIDLLNSEPNTKKILSINSKRFNEELVAILLNITADKNYDLAAKSNNQEKYDIRKLAFTEAMRVFTELSKNAPLSNREDIKFNLAVICIATAGNNLDLNKLADENLIKIIKEDRSASRGSAGLSALLGASLPEPGKDDERIKNLKNPEIKEISKIIEILGDIGRMDSRTEKKVIGFMNLNVKDRSIEAAASYALIKSTKNEAIFDQAREKIKELKKIGDQPEVQRLTKKVDAYIIELIEENNK